MFSDHLGLVPDLWATDTCPASGRFMETDVTFMCNTLTVPTAHSAHVTGNHGLSVSVRGGCSLCSVGLQPLPYKEF